jgi:hypothetical protein
MNYAILFILLFSIGLNAQSMQPQDKLFNLMKKESINMLKDLIPQLENLRKCVQSCDTKDQLIKCMSNTKIPNMDLIGITSNSTVSNDFKWDFTVKKKMADDLISNLASNKKTLQCWQKSSSLKEVGQCIEGTSKDIYSP